MDEPWQRAARLAVLRHRGGIPHDEADAIATVAAWEAHRRWQPDGGANELTWCLRRATGALLDERRRFVRALAEELDVGRVEQGCDDRHHRLEYDDVTDVLEALPSSCWVTAVRLAYGDTKADVARCDGVTPAAVSRRLAAMRQALTAA